MKLNILPICSTSDTTLYIYIVTQTDHRDILVIDLFDIFKSEPLGARSSALSKSAIKEKYQQIQASTNNKASYSIPDFSRTCQPIFSVFDPRQVQ